MNYNIFALQGFPSMSDQDFVEEQGMPQALAFTPDMNLWMTYHVYLGNLGPESQQETERLLLEQFNNMRRIISPRIWLDMDVAHNLSNDNEWWMNDDSLFSACKNCYEAHST